MRGTQFAISACLVNLLVPTEAQPARYPGPVKVPEKRSIGSPTLAHSVLTETTFVETSITARRTLPSSDSITQTTTLSIIPTLTSKTIRSDSTSSDSSAAATSPVTQGSSNTPSTNTFTQIPSMYSSDGGLSHRNLIIVLSTVLGSLSLLLLSLGTWLLLRYRRSRSPFSHRGASPINDEEIASWRSPSYEQKHPVLPVYPDPTKDASTVGVAHHQGWSWDSNAPKQTSPRHHRKASSSASAILPPSPTSMARAPNSRAGLTDETIPGAEPYVATIKHQSSRLSKAAPGHIRSKSRRSSISAKSIWSYNGHSTSHINLEYKSKERQPPYQQVWYDPDDEHVGRELRNFDPRSNTNSPATSVFDETAAGGLSPRPASRPRLWDRPSEDKEIGRAIA